MEKKITENLKIIFEQRLLEVAKQLQARSTVHQENARLRQRVTELEAELARRDTHGSVQTTLKDRP